MKTLSTLEQAAQLIASGRPLLVAGSEAALSKLPRGPWLGGTIPYFMTDEGGQRDDSRVLITELPKECLEAEVRLYEGEALRKLPADYPDRGLSFIVVPAGSASHSTFASDGSSWPGFFNRPLVGWVTGLGLEKLGKELPKVFDDRTGTVSATAAAVMHVKLAPGFVAKTDIINLFEPGEGDTLSFLADGFEATECLVNGERRPFAPYLERIKADTKWPLVTDFSGAALNVSFQNVDQASGKVSFYAPVFMGLEYRLAKPQGDYVKRFAEELERRNVEPIFSCNCILNYLYAELEGKKTGAATGPITFGEIAWMLLNQTMVYVTVERED